MLKVDVRIVLGSRGLCAMDTAERLAELGIVL